MTGRRRERGSNYDGGGKGGVDPNATETTIDSYDALGRPLKKKQIYGEGTIGGTNFSFNKATIWRAMSRL